MKNFDYKKFIRNLGYDPQCRLNRHQSSCAVYRIKHEGKLGIIKMPFGENEFWSAEKHLLREWEILKKFEGLEGLPLPWTLHTDEEIALAKEYISGKPLHYRNKITSVRGQSMAEEAVRTLHDEGYARLELGYENIVVSNESVGLIDLGSAVSINDDEVSTQRFCEHVKYDLERLEEICA